MVAMTIHHVPDWLRGARALSLVSRGLVVTSQMIASRHLLPLRARTARVAHLRRT